MPLTRATATRSLAVLSAAALLGTTAACGGGADLTKGKIGSSLADSVKKQETYTYELTIGSGGQSRKGTGKVDLSGKDPKATLELTESGQKATFLTAGGGYYAKIPTLGTKWIKPSGQQGQALKGVMGQFGIADPVKVISSLDKGTKVTKGAEKKIDGESTTAYTVTVSGSTYADATGLPSAARAAMPKTVTYKVFVDGDGLLRELDNSFTAQGTKVSLKTVYKDYGKKVSIDVPAASELGTLPSEPASPSQGASPSQQASPSASPTPSASASPSSPTATPSAG